MPTASRILAFAGSLRGPSFNKRLLRIAVQGAEAAGAAVTTVDLRDFDLPLYDGDLEERDGLPAGALRLKEIFLQNKGLLIASPEYNSSVTGALKNAIDWVSRPAKKDEAPLACFDGKAAAILSASIGALGGLRGLVHLRSILGNIRVLVLPEQLAVSRAHEAFAENGALKNADQDAAARKIGASLATLVTKLRA